MFTTDEHDDYSREDCLEAAADALAECYRALSERRNTTAPAVAEAV